MEYVSYITRELSRIGRDFDRGVCYGTKGGEEAADVINQEMAKLNLALSTSSDYITITDNYEEYPDIPSGKIKRTMETLDSINPSSSFAPFSKNRLEIHCDEGIFYDYFSVYIYPN
jgi:hypothetical protein